MSGVSRRPIQSSKRLLTNRHPTSDNDPCGNNKSSDLLTMMMAREREHHREEDSSSFTSCNGSLPLGFMDKCPTSPSPVCSPESYKSFATPNEGSCIVPDDDDDANKLDEIKQELSQETYDDALCGDHYTKGEGEGSSRKRSSAHKAAVGYAEPPMRTEFLSEAAEIDSIGTTNYYADDDDGRLQTVVEEEEVEEEEAQEEIRGRYAHQIRRFSSGNVCNVSTIEINPSVFKGFRDEMVSHYGGSESYSGSSWNENSDIESVIERRLKSTVQARSSAAKSRKNKVEAKLNAWKEARTTNIMNRLKREESVIDEWEKKKTTKAKMEMKETEMKLENKRTEAMQEMHRKIRSIQKKAEKKKVKQRAAASKKLAKVTESCNTANTGKLPFCLLFF